MGSEYIEHAPLVIRAQMKEAVPGEDLEVSAQDESDTSRSGLVGGILPERVVREVIVDLFLTSVFMACHAHCVFRIYAFAIGSEISRWSWPLKIQKIQAVEQAKT